MIYTSFRKIYLVLAILFSSFFALDTSFASDFQVDTTNYSRYLATQNGTFSQEGKSVVLKWGAQSILLVKTADIQGSIDMVEFSNLSYATPSVVFIWKLQGKDYAESNQMQLPVVNGIVKMPQPLMLNNFDFIGLVFFESSVSFDTMVLRSENFSDKINTLMTPELVRPSSINLLYGAKFGSTPLVLILGILSILCFAVLIFINRKWAFLSILILWIIFDLRYSYDLYSIIKTTSTTFLSPTTPQTKVYYDFYNFYGFVEESKKHIRGDINFYAPREWPFWYNYSYHTYPMNATWQTLDKPYYALFQVNGVEIKNGKELYIDGKLIDSNVILLSRFDEHSYILKKN